MLFIEGPRGISEAGVAGEVGFVSLLSFSFPLLLPISRLKELRIILLIFRGLRGLTDFSLPTKFRLSRLLDLLGDVSLTSNFPSIFSSSSSTDPKLELCFRGILMPYVQDEATVVWLMGVEGAEI